MARRRAATRATLLAVPASDESSHSVWVLVGAADTLESIRVRTRPRALVGADADVAERSVAPAASGDSASPAAARSAVVSRPKEAENAGSSCAEQPMPGIMLGRVLLWDSRVYAASWSCCSESPSTLVRASLKLAASVCCTDSPPAFQGASRNHVVRGLCYMCL